MIIIFWGLIFNSYQKTDIKIIWVFMFLLTKKALIMFLCNLILFMIYIIFFSSLSTIFKEKINCSSFFGHNIINFSFNMIKSLNIFLILYKLNFHH